MKIILTYVPVWHQGYHEFFMRHQDADICLVWAEDLIGEFDHLARKDPRSLDPTNVVVIVRAIEKFRLVHLAHSHILSSLNRPDNTFVMPDDDESREVASRHLFHAHVTFERVFLRWDKSRSLEQKAVLPDREISLSVFDQEMMAQAIAQSQRASDWYRQVGAVVVKDDEVVLVGHNTHLPTPHINYELGSSRSFFKKGEHIELTTDCHAEPIVVSQAAKRGIALEGAWLYVTTFPCPPCAKLVAQCGFARCYFDEGYAMLDGETALRDAGIEIIQVDMKSPSG